MSRSERLLALAQLLRRHRQAVPGSTLAETLGVSLRTLYRDIAALQAQGASIEGSPGLGYVLKPGHTLPPLMFTPEEVEALALGSRWVIQRGDTRLAEAARDALAKIASVLSPPARRELETSTLLIGPGAWDGQDDATTIALRDAIRSEHRLSIAYRDAQGRSSERAIWPFALGYFEGVRVAIAWCERRADLRHFRTDRIERWTDTGERYPRRRNELLAEWRQRELDRSPAVAGRDRPPTADGI
jgi:predicted DNA-binding transcriptional regulator YafY